jgi:lipopolysaccharide/colanic/teichoic acid biosynthesis glycosyltransferase
MTVKRLLDLLVSSTALVMLLPLFLLLAAMIKKEDGGPVFYRGVRVGKEGRPFTMYKVRTMIVDAEKMGASSTPEDDPRVTDVGRFLRKYKLDELPQLINVLKGEMSLVGPRPQVPWAVELYSAEEKRLLSVQPGMTDWASIRFRNEGEILKGSPDPDRDYQEKIAPEKIRLGLEYVARPSLAADLKIIVATLVNVAKATGRRVMPWIRR